MAKSRYNTTEEVDNALDMGVSAKQKADQLEGAVSQQGGKISSLEGAVSQQGSKLSSIEGSYNKYNSVVPTSSMSVNEATFTTQSVVKVTSAISITSVSDLNYEVVFDVPANVSISIPSSIPTIGEADPTCRRLYSFLGGNLVVGNFE